MKDNYNNEVVDYLCEKLKNTTSPKSVKRLCRLIKLVKYAELAEQRIFSEENLNKVKQLCIDGYFNTKYIIEKYSIMLNNAVGEKRRELEAFLKEVREIENSNEDGTNA